MSTTNHSAIVVGAAANAGTINGPLGQLDAAMGDVDALTTTASTLTAAVNELDGELGNVASMTTTAASVAGSINELDAELGNVAGMTTAATTVAGSINELDAELGNLALLTSDATGNHVAAINSVKADADALEVKVGSLSLLTTDSTGNIVAAINSVKADVEAEEDNRAAALAAEVVARNAAIAAEATARVADVDAEQTARTVADNLLDDRIDTLVLGSGTSSAEVVDARVAINYGVAPTVLSDTVELAALDTYNVKAYGAVGDGTTNDQAEIDAAITAANAAGGGVVFFPRGTYIVDFVTLKNNVTLQGAGRRASVIKTTATSPTVDRGTLYISATADIENITIRDLQVQNLVPAISRRCLLFSTATNNVRNVTLQDCYFYNSSDHHNVVQFGTSTGCSYYNVQINRCIFEGQAAATSVANGCLLRLNASTAGGYAVNSHLVVSNCEFINGSRAMETITIGGAGPNFAFIGNHCTGQTMGGISIYHTPSRVIGNYLHNLTAAAQTNNDSGAIWMDTAGMAGSVVAENMIQNIVGNGIFAEDLTAGTIANNVIEGCSKRVGDTFDATTLTAGASDNTSDGGHGILIAGGCIGTNISGNTIRECESNAIFVARDMGPHWSGSYFLKELTISNNFLFAFGENGIEFDTEWLNQNGGHKIIGNHIESQVVGAASGIKQTGTTQSAGRLTILGNTIGGGTDAGATTAIVLERLTSGNSMRIVSNTIAGDTAAIEADGMYGVFAFNEINGPTLGTEALGSNATILGNQDAASDIDRLHLNGQYFAQNLKTPASASAPGVQGQICWNGTHLFACVAANTWVRVALTSW